MQTRSETTPTSAEAVSSGGERPVVGPVAEDSAREVDELFAAVTASLEAARAQVEPGTSIRAHLDRATETLTRGSERIRQLLALMRSDAGLHAGAPSRAPSDEASRPVQPGRSPDTVETPVPAMATASSVRPTAGRVVILDDEEPLVRVGKHLLKRIGHEATGFIHPREALEALERDPRGFDVLITDLTMPEMSGHDVARAVAQIRSDLPIILLSGKLQDDGDALGIPNPVFRLGKPYTREQLQQVVEAALRGG